MLYKITTNDRVDNPKFVVYNIDHKTALNYLHAKQIDLLIGSNYVVVSGSDKSFSAGDELRSYLRDRYDYYLFEKYGSKAFPVLVSVEYLKRETKVEFGMPSKPESGGIEEGKEQQKGIGGKEIGKIGESKPETEITSKESKLPFVKKPKYSTPETLSPPSLLEKLIYSFLFVIPSYFTIQVFSSSLIEDKISRRLEVLISATSSYSIILGKAIPYLVLSVITVVIVSLILKENIGCLLFVFPIVLFLMSVQCFISIISRSYREATFLLLVVSLLITTYIFIPAVFSGTIPVSEISPITQMLSFFETLSMDFRDYIISTFQFYSMAMILFYLSSKAMDSEIMYSKSIVDKIMLVTSKVIKKDYHTFIASLFSIPFVFMVEFFLLSILFILPQSYSIPVLIASIALVEETFKATFVYAAFKNKANLFSSALFSAFGFFVGEKILIVANIATQYNFLFLSKYLLLPLLLHSLTMLVFVLLLRFGFRRALIASSIIHFIYNYAMVVMLL
ncbi:hypothetical protein DRO97_01595 [Archaeoglobales archaeon]|nr:MAG: hypothetical protein DRO97_01595 [Archaeoglobales archaeon]